MSKLFVFDMDGTILNSKNAVQQATIEAMKIGKEQGHKFIIATGRPFLDATRDIGEAAKYIDYFVCNNGTYYSNFDKSDVKYLNKVNKKFFDIAKKIGTQYECFFAIHGSWEAKRSFLGKEMTFDWNNPEYTEFLKFKDDFISVDQADEWSNDQNICQISLRSDSKTIQKINALFQQYKNEVDIHIANDVYLDINAKDISKLSGIKVISEKMGYDIKDVIAFGDSGNDIQMLSGVGCGVCMGNGNQIAKDAADIIIDTNDTNAIHDKILEFCQK